MASTIKHQHIKLFPVENPFRMENKEKHLYLLLFTLLPYNTVAAHWKCCDVSIMKKKKISAYTRNYVVTIYILLRMFDRNVTHYILLNYIELYCMFRPSRLGGTNIVYTLCLLCVSSVCIQLFLDIFRINQFRAKRWHMCTCITTIFNTTVLT